MKFVMLTGSSDSEFDRNQASKIILEGLSVASHLLNNSTPLNFHQFLCHSFHIQRFSRIRGPLDSGARIQCTIRLNSKIVQEKMSILRSYEL